MALRAVAVGTERRPDHEGGKKSGGVGGGGGGGETRRRQVCACETSVVAAQDFPPSPPPALVSSSRRIAPVPAGSRSRRHRASGTNVTGRRGAIDCVCARVLRGVVVVVGGDGTPLPAPDRRRNGAFGLFRLSGRGPRHTRTNAVWDAAGFSSQNTTRTLRRLRIPLCAEKKLGQNDRGSI